MPQPNLIAADVLERASQAAAGKQQFCPRCRNSAVTRADAPDGSGAWFISTCENCCFSWRSTEDVTHVLELEEGKVYRLWDSEITKLPVQVPTDRL